MQGKETDIQCYQAAADFSIAFAYGSGRVYPNRLDAEWLQCILAGLSGNAGGLRLPHPGRPGRNCPGFDVGSELDVGGGGQSTLVSGSATPGVYLYPHDAVFQLAFRIGCRLATGQGERVFKKNG